MIASGTEHAGSQKAIIGERYQADCVVLTYDQRRFGSVAGRIFQWLERRSVCKAFRDLPRDAIIGDVPCGTGRLAETLLARGLDVTGVDISSAMLRVAEARLARFGSRFRAIVADITALRQSGLRFDALLSARFLVHFPLREQIDLLSTMAGLSRGGVVFTHAVDTRFHRTRLRLTSVFRRRPSAAYPLTPAQITTLVEQAGLREIRRHHVLPILSQAIVLVAVPWGAPEDELDF